MDDMFCPACAAQIDAADNFCRMCGAAARARQLPAVRRAGLPAVWAPQVSPAVKGAAVMAAGTLGQFLLRRAVRGVFGASPQSQAIKIRRPRGRDGMADEAQIITETVTMRRVRIRRPG
jgi:hypothetical protein